MGAHMLWSRASLLITGFKRGKLLLQVRIDLFCLFQLSVKKAVNNETFMISSPACCDVITAIAVTAVRNRDVMQSILK